MVNGKVPKSITKANGLTYLTGCIKNYHFQSVLMKMALTTEKDFLVLGMVHIKNITTYVDGEEYLTYYVKSLSDDKAEITMYDNSGDSMDLRVKKVR